MTYILYLTKRFKATATKAAKWSASHHLGILIVYLSKHLKDHKSEPQLPVGLIAQLVEQCTGIASAEVMGSNPVQAGICFSGCSSCVHNLDDHHIFSMAKIWTFKNLKRPLDN